MADRRARLIWWSIAGVAATGLGLGIAAGDDAVIAAWSWRAPWEAVQALISDRPDKPWDWVERLSWVLAIGFAIPSLVIAARSLKVARQPVAPARPIITPVGGLPAGEGGPV